MNITNVKAELAGVLHGTTVNQITDINGVFRRAASRLLLDIDPQETKRVVDLSPLFNGVYDYNCPTDLKGNKVIDIRPQINRANQDVLLQRYGQEFDINKPLNWSSFTMGFNQAIKTLRINNQSLPAGNVINTINSVNTNGTFTGTVLNIRNNNINFVNTASVAFDLPASSGAYIENSTQGAVDLSDLVNQATQFVYVYLPSPTVVTSITFRWGSDSSNYYTQSVSVNQQGNAFQQGWNLLAFDWSTAGTFASPDPTSITYIDFIFTTDGTAVTGCAINYLVSRISNIWEIVYYSKFLFRDVITGAFQEEVTDDSNLINLDTESYNLFFNRVAVYCAQQAQGVSATQFDYKFFDTEYQQGVARYMALYKSEVQKPSTQYYQPNRPGYNQFLGARFTR